MCDHRDWLPRKTWSISPAGRFVRGTVREKRSQFSQRENCSLALALTLSDFSEIEKPCPFELRDIFLNSTPYSLDCFFKKTMPAQSARHFS